MLNAIKSLRFLWPAARQRDVAGEGNGVLARFIRTDAVGTGELPVLKVPCRIGRAPGNELCLDNDSVSAHHAELNYFTGRNFTLLDLGSTNGTWVNGKQIQQCLLHDGDVVELGEVRLHFRAQAYVSAPPQGIHAV